MTSVVYAVLNELSLHSNSTPITGTKYDARKWVKSFYELLKKAQSEGVEGLRTYRSFDEIQLVSGYTLRDWSADIDVDDEMRRRVIDIFLQLSRISEFPENQQGNPLINCNHNKQLAHGIWGAIYLESFSISLLTDKVWDTHELFADVDEMDEETANIIPRTETVRHLATDLHLPYHINWLKDQTNIVIPNGNLLWMNRSRLFPSLSFCKNTKEQIRSLIGHELRQVIKKLKELQTVCQNWTTGAFDKNWLAHCDPESQITLTTYAAEHSFECEDGITRLFSLKVRFTPGAGRIFFYPDTKPSGEHVLFIGHIGQKLPNVSY